MHIIFNYHPTGNYLIIFSGVGLDIFLRSNKHQHLMISLK